MGDEQPEAGLFASLRRMAATLVALAQTRLELEEQIAYASTLLLWSISSIIFGALAVLLLAFTIVIAFWDDHRLLAASLVTATLALLALAAYLAMRRLLNRRPRFFAATASELARDAATLHGRQP